MPRRTALDVLKRVELDHAYSHIALANAFGAHLLSERDRGLATELVYGTLTWQRTIDRMLDCFVRRGVESLDVPILIDLRLAIYQLVFLDRIPEHAIVDEAVNLAKEESGKGAGGLVNGVLRSILRSRADLKGWDEADRDKQPARYLAQRYSLPDWLAERFLSRHGFERALAMAEAFTKRPALFLRYLGDEPGIVDKLPEGVSVVEGLPGAFVAAGLSDALRSGLEDYSWVVQDLGSQLVGWFADAERGQSVLDACAGLGGKTLALAEVVGSEGRVEAVEPNLGKVEKLQQALAATKLAGRVGVHQAMLQDFAKSGDRSFDIVLVDAPCTGLGVMRRHPEMRWRRSEDDIVELVTIQRELLEAAAGLVKPGGVLVYSVCTFSGEEGPDQVAHFLKNHPEFERAGAPKHANSAQIAWPRYLDENSDMALNPLDHDADAFYAARLRRKA
ncbi:MAG: 16S rRNA (cytosine(967)-C(5))-methyltransferase RsmB [Bradymonadaceae bacterium]|nr:16S rRNA (cytosine(967)-C(5))-methyltransferase RsmB [Lujinxingiaceae bacterium]